MFNDIIVTNFTAPAFAEELEGATHSLELGNPVCGDRIKVQLRVQAGRIDQARYQAWGCATSLATGNVFCAHVDGKAFDEVLPVRSAAIDGMLGELEPAQHHCLEMLHALYDQLSTSVLVAR